MQNLNDKLNHLASLMGRKPVDLPKKDFAAIREEYSRQANADIQQQQQQARKQRILNIHGKSDLNPKWTFDNLVEDSDDVREAISIAQSFIAAHDDPEWRNSGSHMMIFYGDYGRGKSHIAGAIAHQLIEQFEISVLYRQLSSLLEMRFSSFDYNAQDKIGEKFREIQHELLNVDLLILDEVCVNESHLKKNTQSWLGNLLRQRLVNNKNCILITNHELSALEVALGSYCFESIKEYDTYRVRFSGPSRRTQLKDDIGPVTSGYQPNQIK